MPPRIELDIFEGPLNVLLTLVQSREISLTRIKVLEILDQTIDELRVEPDLNESGEAIIIIGTLLELKSKLLLPGEVNLQEEIDALKEDLLEKLFVHRRLTQVLDALEFRMSRRLKMYSRPSQLNDREEILIPMENQDPDILKSLLEGLREMARQDTFRVDYNLLPIEHYFEWVEQFKDRGSISLYEMASQRKDLLDLVGLFIALLEMVRQGKFEMKSEGIKNDVFFYWRQDKDEAVEVDFDKES